MRLLVLAEDVMEWVGVKMGSADVGDGVVIGVVYTHEERPSAIKAGQL